MIHNILKKILKFHPFKLTLVHKLNGDDLDRGVEFCENMIDIITTERIFLTKLFFLTKLHLIEQ